MSDYEIDYEDSCPKCGHSPLHYRDCLETHCNDGYIDASDEDPINYAPGELESRCHECEGTGTEVWCPHCGANLSGIPAAVDEDDLDEDDLSEYQGELDMPPDEDY